MINKTVFTYILIIGIAGTAGATMGVLGKRLLGQEIIDYSGFNPEDYRGDGKALYEDYSSTSNPNLSKYSPADLVNIGLEKYRETKYSYSFGIGTASTIVSQTIRNFQIRYADDYFEESISYSKMVSVANRVKQTGDEGDLTLYKGNATGAEESNYPGEDQGQLFKQADYKSTYGKTLNEMFIYLISNKSVLNDKCEVKRVENDGIQVKLELHPDIATFYYKYQMKNISGLDGLPSFSYVTLTYNFDKYMTIKTLHVDEQYSASMGMTVNITNSIDYYYFPNERLPIPKNNEKLNYSKGE